MDKFGFSFGLTDMQILGRQVLAPIPGKSFPGPNKCSPLLSRQAVGGVVSAAFLDRRWTVDDLE